MRQAYSIIFAVSSVFVSLQQTFCSKTEILNLLWKIYRTLICLDLPECGSESQTCRVLLRYLQQPIPVDLWLLKRLEEEAISSTLTKERKQPSCSVTWTCVKLLHFYFRRLVRFSCVGFPDSERKHIWTETLGKTCFLILWLISVMYKKKCSLIFRAWETFYVSAKKPLGYFPELGTIIIIIIIFLHHRRSRDVHLSLMGDCSDFHIQWTDFLLCLPVGLIVFKDHFVLTVWFVTLRAACVYSKKVTLASSV